MNIRKLVKDEIATLGVTPYRLWVLCGGKKQRGKAMVPGKVSRDMIFRWLRGDANLGATSLGFILDALELEIRRKPGGQARVDRIRAGIAELEAAGAERQVRLSHTKKVNLARAKSLRKTWAKKAKKKR